MVFIVKNERPDPIPPGLHDAFLYSIIDLGTTVNKKFGHKAHNVMITWELTDVLIEIGDKMLPRAISNDYNVKLSKKSNLYKDLKSYHGRDLTKEEMDGYDLEQLLGKPFKLQVIHNETDSGVFANINAVMEGDKKGKPVNPLFSYNLEHKVEPMEDQIPGWVIEKIKESDEYKEFPK